MQPLAWISKYLIKRFSTLRLVSGERSFAINETACILLIYCIALACCLARFIVSSFPSEARQSVELKNRPNTRLCFSADV